MREIKFEYNGQNYTLAFTRESIKTMEQQGVDFSSVDAKILTSCEVIFYGAFMVYHKGIKRRLVSEIWDYMEDKEKLVETLADMIADTISDFMSTKDDGDPSKKITWGVV